MMSAPAVTSALASDRWRLDGQRSPSTPQCRKTTTVSAVLRARRTSSTSRGTIFADASPGLPRARGPRRDQVIVEDLRRSDDRDPLPVHRLPERGVRALRVQAGADDREPVALRRRHRVAEARLPVVHAVVVRERRDVDRASAQGRERARRRAEDELLDGGAAPVRDRGLEVDDREVGLPEHGLDGIEHGRRRRRELVRQDAFEVDVPAEREDDLLAASERPSHLRGGRLALLAVERRERRRSRGEKREHDEREGGETGHVTKAASERAWCPSTIARP